jgi:hypothetical protein
MDTIFTDGQLTKLIETMRQKQMTPERFNSLLSSGILADVFDPAAKFNDRDAFRAALKFGTLVGDVFRLTVDDESLEQMIVAGYYDWHNDDITVKRFPISGDSVGEYEARYFHFDRKISSENAVAGIKEAGWEPAKIEHLLSHGKTFPEEQRKFPIVGLGSVAKVDGRRVVPSLSRDDSKRDLGLDWFDFVWHASYRCLAVRKVSVA